MQTIRDPADVARIEDAFLRELIAGRLDAMAHGEPFEADVHGYVVVIEVSDPIPAVLAAVEGLDLDDAAGGGVEYVEQHPGWYELVIIPGCGDFGIVAFVPRDPAVDPRLLDLCARQAVLAPDD